MVIPNFLDSKKNCVHVTILLNSYEKYFGQPLLANSEGNEKVLDELWNANFVLVSHGIEVDPIFNFANKRALELFEMDFESFTQLPSRKSAEEITQQERDALLDEVTRNGCISNYTGVRVSSSGRKFFIENAKVWNLIDQNAKFYGQAAMFTSWNYLK